MIQFLKSSAKIKIETNEMLFCAIMCYDAYKSHGYSVLITSGIDSVHRGDSKHYSGNAFDLRINNVLKLHVKSIFEELRVKLGNDFDVVLERDHIHVEYDPKKI
jgi:uncharacterized protein YcbK (DUF882 family)